MDRKQQKLLVETAALAGELMLTSGAETFRAEDTMAHILKSWLSSSWMLPFSRKTNQQKKIIPCTEKSEDIKPTSSLLFYTLIINVLLILLVTEHSNILVQCQIQSYTPSDLLPPSYMQLLHKQRLQKK